MILLRSLLILLVLALTPIHVAAVEPQIMPDTHVMAQMGAMDDCCDSGTHQAGCQMQQPLPESAAVPAPQTGARQMRDLVVQDRRQGRRPDPALRPPIPG